MNLILLLPQELDETGCARLAGDRSEHIRNVLRATPGKPLRIGLLNGPKGSGTVEELCGKEVVLYCEFDAEPPPRQPVDLLLAMPRPKVMKRLWAQLAALGVARIFITNAEKVERFYFDTHILEPDFYNARFIEGLQQAGDTLLPEVNIVKQLKPFLETGTFPNSGTGCVGACSSFPKDGKRLVADPSAERSLFQCMENVDATPPSRFQGLEKHLLVAIGPEGGWTPHELELFTAHGFEVFSMGPRILRTDTACVALLAQLNQLFTLAQV